MAIKKGDKIKVEYTGTLDDNSVFDTSVGKEPLEFVVGSDQIIKGFDEAVIDMNVNEEKTIKLSPAEAYGEHNPQFVKKIPKEQLPQGQEPKVGMVLGLNLPDGKQMPAIITVVDEKEITIDLNHPLAGKSLNFKIKIIAF